MKKTLIAFAVLSTLGLTAQAENSLTLYGLVDLGFTTESNVNQGQPDIDGNPISGTRVGVDSGLMQGSRFGIRGSEDLGSGLRGIFQLENGFSADRGIQRSGHDNFFDRKAVLGLSSDHWGQVTIGRQTDMLDDAGAFTSVKDFGGMTDAVHSFTRLQGARVNNSLRYDTANYSGFKFSAIYGFGENVSSRNDGQSFGVGAMYANGPLGAYLGYFQSKRGSMGNESDIDYQNAGFLQTSTSYVMPGDVAFKTLSLGASYQMHAVRLYGNWSRVESGEEADDVFCLDKVKQNVFELGADWAVTEPLHALFSMQHATTSAGANSVLPFDPTEKGKLTQFNVGLDYWLSRRTDMYAMVSYQKPNDNYLGTTGIFSMAAGSQGNTSTAFALGVRHKF